MSTVTQRVRSGSTRDGRTLDSNLLIPGDEGGGGSDMSGPTSLDTVAQRDNTELLVTVNSTGILKYSILRCQNIEDSVLSVETCIYMKVGIINYNQIYIYDMQM